MRTHNQRSTRGALRRVLPWCTAFALLLGMPGLTGIAAAASSTNGATLNGAAKVTVPPAASITAAVSTTSGNGGGNRVGSIGWRIATSPPGSMSCVDVVPDRNGETTTTSFAVTAPPAAGTYNAYFAAYSDDACITNQSNVVTLTDGVVVAVADLGVTVNDGVGSVTAGDGVTRTSTVRLSNAPGGAPAANVALSVGWPAGLARGTVTPSQGSCSGSASFTCSLGSVPAGGGVTVTATYTVPAGTTSSPQVITASATTSTPESTTANNSASDSDVVTTSADLATTKNDGAASVVAGDGVTRTFTLTARNLGPSDAQAVQISDAWPAGYARGTIANAHGSCSGSSAFTCSVGRIPAGGSRAITVTYTVPAETTGAQTNTASTTSTTQDPSGGNNSEGDTNPVNVLADLALEKTDGVGSVVAGRSTTYTLTLTNEGPAVVPAGVTISDPIPSGTTGSETEAECTIVAATFTCSTPVAIPVEGSVSFRVTLSVEAGFGGTSLRNVASIASSPVADPSPGNDSSVDVDSVTPAGEVSFEGLLAGPALADMYPVDVVDSGSFYYVVDPGRYRVVKVDRTSGQIVASRGGHQGRTKGQFGAARAISVDTAGNIYVADTPNNRIQVFSPNLEFLRAWGGGGTEPGRFDMVYGVTVGPGRGVGGVADEVVYTTDGGRVQKFTRTGTFISEFGLGALNQPRQLAISPVTHDLYVVSARDRQIVVFDEHGLERFRFGSGGTGNGQFVGDIRGIDIDDDGRVYVSDDGNHRVQVFTANGAYLYQFGNTGTGDQYLTDVRGLTVTHDGIVCVADEWDFGLKEYRIGAQGSSAAFVRMMFGDPAPVPGFNSPRGLAVNDDTGAIYGVDWWNQRLERFDTDGTFRTAWGRRGTTAEPGSINFAWDAAVDPETGNVFVANRESHEIEVFDANGGYLTRWGLRGTAAGRFTFPQGVAFDPTNGTLLVTDSGNGRIQRFSVGASGQGTYLTSYGAKGAAVGQFSVPAGIDVASDGTIWVADTQNDRIQRRNPATGAWTAFSVAQSDTVAFRSPWGVNVGPAGQIWVSDSGNDRLVRMSASGVFAGVVDAASLGLASMDAPFEVAFGVDGRIFVSVVWDNVVLELSQT